MAGREVRVARAAARCGIGLNSATAPNVLGQSAGQSAGQNSRQSAWQRDVSASLDEAVRNASDGDLTKAEVAADRATSILAVARLQSKAASPDFFESTIAQLDKVLNATRENARLTEHVTLARIELAQLRSALEIVPAGAPTSLNATDLLLPSAADSVAKPKGTAKADSGQVFVGAPRAIAAGATLDPASLGGNLLDATSMPRNAEILEPPASRLFADDVRVENLTIDGATQTIDGIHWKNVTFIGTRIRYEGGEADLTNVRFIHCMFGFTPDERGARIASAIALGQNTIVIE